MTNRQIEIQAIIRKLRFKYGNIKDNQERNKKQCMLTRIIGSFAYVYPNYSQDMCDLTRAFENRKQAKKRTNKYLQGMYDGYSTLFFVTLTFSEECLEKTDEKTRRQYASRFLNEHFRDYYANIDYGTKNEREHYHAVVSDKVSEQARKEWQRHGNINFKKIRENRKDVRKVGTYMRKLTNHAHKVGTGKAFHKRGMKEVDELPF